MAKSKPPKILQDIFPVRLQLLRKSRGLSLRDVGYMIGKTYQFIAKLENGPGKSGAKPSMDTVEDLGRAFGVRPAYFLEDNPLCGDQMPLEVLLKNYDNDIRQLIEKELTSSHLVLAKYVKDAGLSDSEIQMLIRLVKGK